MTLPAIPLRSDGPEVFANKADAFLGALPQFETDMNAVGTLATATLLAAPAAIAAANYKGDYAAGTTYQVGHSTSYLGDIWYAKTVNTGVTPVAGAAWQRMSATIADPTGSSGKVLGTNGTVTLWVVRLPDQTGQAGKVLSTDGTTESWVNFLVSPTFTGTPAAPTAAAGTSTTQLATTAFATTAASTGGDAAMAYALAF